MFRCTFVTHIHPGDGAVIKDINGFLHHILSAVHCRFPTHTQADLDQVAREL